MLGTKEVGELRDLLSTKNPWSNDLNSLTQMKRQTWTPTILRRDIVVLLSLLFVATAVTLGVLNLISHRIDGLCDADSKDHYLWTYAPTALFTIIAAIWSQVEYRTKQIQPWRSMAEGSKDASESVLLDYISGWNIMVLIKALKRRQVLVVAAVSASLLLQLLIILSTGLFTISEVPALHRTILEVKDGFIQNGSHFHPDQVNARPAAFVQAFAQTDLEKAPGTTLTEAFQGFPVPEDLGASVRSVEVEVDVLSSHMSRTLRPQK